MILVANLLVDYSKFDYCYYRQYNYGINKCKVFIHLSITDCEKRDFCLFECDDLEIAKRYLKGLAYRLDIAKEHKRTIVDLNFKVGEEL